MDTGVFVRRPLLWLQKASDLESTQLCSPNFGYKHFLKLFARKGIDHLDLSSVKLILNGAEPISWDLCEEFLNALEPFGLARTTMFPVYGLAEATVGVTFPQHGRQYSRILVDRHSLQIGQPFTNSAEGDVDTVSFLKVGKPIRHVEIRIADDQDEALPDSHVGHIQIRGESVTTGIYNDDEASKLLFAPDGWLRSGDCGVIVDGELVITGRSKDIIIINGQNYYPHDLEEIIARLDGIDLGKVVVAGVSLTASQTEELVAFILYRKDIDAFRSIAEDVRAIVAEHTGLEIDHCPLPECQRRPAAKCSGHSLRTPIAMGNSTIRSSNSVAVPHGWMTLMTIRWFGNSNSSAANSPGNGELGPTTTCLKSASVLLHSRKSSSL
jgi:acyl-CoA synthetase (AMP-forming)/AMP-acid ligase II